MRVHNDRPASLLHGLLPGAFVLLGLHGPATSYAGQTGEDAAQAILVMMHRAVEGEPLADARMRHFALPDPKLKSRFEEAGFRIGVAPYASGLDDAFLRQFNVVVVPHPCLPGSEPGLAEVVREKQALLLAYVRDGGGMLVLRTPGWQFGKDVDEINRWLAPCDIEVLSEQVRDDECKVTLDTRYEFSWTDNLARHPVTEGVRGLFYTTYHHMYSDSTSPVRAGPDWTVLVRGKRTTKSLKTVKGGKPPPPSPGTYPSEPPLMAVRDYGKGRIAVWPLNSSCVWQDGYHTLWGDGLTMEGVSSDMHGDAARLLGNLMAYLAEPSRDRFGGYVPPMEEKKLDQEPGFARIDWDRERMGNVLMPHCFVGLIGAKSGLTSGSGIPEQFIHSAREAGYDFIAFAEDLATLTQDAFGRLSATCAELSTETFKAYPGFEYQDDSGNSWVTFSDRLRWPEKGWWSQAHTGRLKINNPLSRGCQWPPVILIKAGKNPEPAFLQGNFKVFSLFTYEGGSLVDDSLDTYLRLQRMRFLLCPVAVHIVRFPEEVTSAREGGGYQTYVRWFDHSMAEPLSGHVGRHAGRYVFTRSSFVSQGPVIEDARIRNFGSSDLAIPGNDRFRFRIKASSPAGLQEVAVFDSDAARPWRRFLPKGAETFETSVDHFHDRQYDFVLRVTDTEGRAAYGWDCWTCVQENSFPRCSDNINTMPRGKWWGPPEDMQNVRGVENYLAVRNLTYVGLPMLSGVPDCTRPAVEYYPRLSSRFGTVLECRLNHHYPVSVDGNPDRNDRAECAVTNESVQGMVRHTLFTPWQDGPLAVLVEGNLQARQAFSTKRPEVMRFQGREGADCVALTRQDGSVYIGKLTAASNSFMHTLAENGFAAAFPQPFRGGVGLIPLQEGILVHAFTGGSEYCNFRALLWYGDRAVPAGAELTYRYIAVMGPLGGPPDSRFVTDIRDAMGVAGAPAYRVTPQLGKIVSTRFILQLSAEEHGFAGTVTQAELPLNLPVRIDGLNPRWDAAVWYKGPQKLAVAEWVVNEMNQRYAVRRTHAVRDEILRFPVTEDGSGMLQLDTAFGDKGVFIGNLLVCNAPAVCLTLVDRRPGKAAFVAHNPTDEAVACEVSPAPGFTLFGEFRQTVNIPPGSSVRKGITADSVRE